MPTLLGKTAYAVGAVVLAGVTIAAVLVGVNILTDRHEAAADRPLAQPLKKAETPLAPGWRWEAFHDVQVQVPDAWERRPGRAAACWSP